MEKALGQSDPRITQYFTRVFQPEDALLSQIRERSERAGLPSIQVGAADGLHLEVLTRAFGARKAVEIGTLGGYSGVSLLRGMGRQGYLYTFEYEPKHAEVARESFQSVGFEKQVEIFVGPALANLPKIEKEGPFDLVFIDADKENYPGYLDWAARNLRKGGVVLGDNSFGWGMIADTSFEDPEDAVSVRGLQEFNRRIASSGLFRATILPTGEGLTLGVRI